MKATKTRFNKLTAWVLTLAMIMTFIPYFTIGVSAATTGSPVLKNSIVSQSTPDDITVTYEFKSSSWYPTDGTTYKLYADTNKTTEAGSVTLTDGETPTLEVTLNEAPVRDTRYYLTATAPDRDESNFTSIVVKTYRITNGFTFSYSEFSDIEYVDFFQNQSTYNIVLPPSTADDAPISVVFETVNGATVTYSGDDELVDGNGSIEARVVSTEPELCYTYTINFTTMNLNGQGTEIDPYLLTSATDLKHFADCLNNCGASPIDADESGYGNFYGYYFKLTKDIDLDGIEWEPIGHCGSTYFAGHFDGDNHTISNMTTTGRTSPGDYEIDCSRYNAAGLFGWCAFGTVKNVKVDKADVTAIGQNQFGYAGGLVAVPYGCTVSNCSVSNSVIESGRVPTTNANTAGGVAGMAASAAFEKCSSVNNTVRGTMYVGGFIGSQEGESTYTDCYVAGTTVESVMITSSFNCNAGGFAGASQNGNYVMTNCFVYDCKTQVADGANAEQYEEGILSKYEWASDAAETTNCYYYTAQTYDDEGTAYTAVAKSTDEFANGDVLTLLNEDRTGENAVWTQGDSYPVFAVPTYSVAFDANGGTGEMDSEGDIAGEYTLPECTFTAPDGKQFAGWATSADGEVITDKTIQVSNNITLYAMWETIATYNLWVCGTQVTSINASDILGNGKIKYDADASTLTFTDADISFEDETKGIVSATEDIETLTIVGVDTDVDGSNTLTYTGTNSAISVLGNLVLKGTFGDVSSNDGMYVVSGKSVTVDENCAIGNVESTDADSAINGTDFIAIDGTVGDIKASVQGVKSEGKITISGTVGKILGGKYGIYTDGMLEITTPLEIYGETAAVAAGGGIGTDKVVVREPAESVVESIEIAGKDEGYTTIGTEDAEGNFTAAKTVKYDNIIEYPVFVGDESFNETKLVIDGKEGTATYDPDTKTLTLDNFVYEGEGLVQSNISCLLSVFAEDATILLKGENKLIGTNVDIKHNYGVYSSKGITVKGTDKNNDKLFLELDGSDVSAGFFVVSGDATFENCMIDVCGQESGHRNLGLSIRGNLSLDNAIIDVNDETNNGGISSVTLSITDSTVTAYGTTYAISSATLNYSYGYEWRTSADGEFKRTELEYNREQYFEIRPVVPEITEISFNTESSAYNSETKTFTVTKDTAFEVYLKGNNFEFVNDTFYENTYFGFVPDVENSENALAASLADFKEEGFTVAVDTDTATITLSFDYDAVKDFLGENTKLEGICYGDGNSIKEENIKAVNVTVAKLDPTYTPPVAKTELVYNGVEQELITEGTVSGGTMKYSIGGAQAITDIPTRTDAGEYTVNCIIVGDTHYNNVNVGGFVVTIAQAVPAQNPEKLTTARVRRGSKLSDAAVTYGEFFAINAATVLDGTFTWVDDTQTISEDTTKKMKFTPSDDNYAEIEFDVAVDCYSSGGGSSSSSTTTTTTKNDDGSTTKTTTNKSTGTVTEVTTDTDGSTTTVETKKDGTVTTTEKDAEGNTTTTVEKSDGTTTTTEKTADGTSTVTTENADGSATEVVTQKDGTKVTTETAADGETTIEIDIPNNKETEVTVPVENAEDVASVVVTDKDGNETEITDFEVTEDGIKISVSGDCTVAFGFTEKKIFDDVHPVNHWATNDIDYTYINGLMKGTSENLFSPDMPLTRAMLVTVLYRLEGEPRVSGITSFADLEKGQYYLDAVCWAQVNGIVNGVTKTEFAPNDNIIREQIAAIMHRYAKFKGYDVSAGENTNILSYTDFESISEYAIASMQYAVGSGLIKGKSESTLNPLDNATRAEIAAILHRFIEANK